jgi:hypothetical protein
LKSGRHNEELGQFYNSFLIFCEVSAYQGRPIAGERAAKAVTRTAQNENPS